MASTWVSGAISNVLVYWQNGRPVQTGAVRRVTGHRWRPQRVITDFESSLLLAIQTELPNSQSQGCYFHFCQSLWRRVQELGLSGPYQRHGSLQKCIQKFMAMGYLPVALVRQNYRILSTEIATVRLVQRFPMLANFIQYLERNYIVDGCQFTPQLWNVFGRTSDNRTNNFVEGFHQRWNAALQRRHPSLWIFLRQLKDEQRLVETTTAAAERGEPRPLPKRKWRRLEERIVRLKREYNQGVRTLDEFWNAVQHSVHNFV